MRGELDATRNLLQRLNRRVLGLAADPRDAAAFGEAVLGVDFGKMILDEVADADAGAALLTRLRHKDHVAIERHVQPLQQQHGHHAGGQVVLVVDGAAAIHPAAFAGGAQGRVSPFLVVRGHGVAVTHHEDRPLPAVAFQPRNQVRSIHVRSDDHATGSLPCRRPLSRTRRRCVRFRVGCVYRAATPPDSGASSLLRRPTSSVVGSGR